MRAMVLAIGLCGCVSAPEQEVHVVAAREASLLGEVRPVTHWTFDDCGAVADDSGSDGRRDATLENGAVRAPSMPGYGQALSLDGADDRAVFANPATTWGDQITVTAWIRPSPPHQTNYGALLYRMLGDDGSKLLVSTSGAVLFGKLGVQPASYPENALYTKVAPNAWTHVALRYDGARWAWFQAGVKMTASDRALTGNLVTGTAAGYLGQSNPGAGTYHYRGLLDDVRIYDVALPDADLAALASADVGATELVARWRLDGDGNDVARDNDCSLVGGGNAWVTDPERGAVLALSGTNGLSCGTDASLAMRGAVTLSAWVKLTGDPPVEGWPLVAKDGAWSLRLLDGGVASLHLPGAGPGADEWAAMPSVSDGEWHHVTATWDGQGVKTAWVDGRFALASATGAGPMGTSAGAVRIGRGASGAGFAGRIDDVRVYRGALSPDEIRVTGDASLVSRWSFDECSSGTALDSGASGVRGATLENGATRAPSKAGLGNALSLDGVDDRARFANDGAPWTDQITVAAWVRPRPPHESNFAAVAYRLLGDDGSRLLVASAGTVLHGKLGIAPAQYPELVAYTTIPADQWSHVAIQYDGATWTLFLDGIAVASAPLSGAVVTGTATGWIGQQGPGTGTYHFRGEIDELRLYRRALEPGELWHLAHPDEVHVAPDGAPDAWGSPDDPLDLPTALTNAGLVRPGTTAWLAGGEYHGQATGPAFLKDALLSGTPQAPIVYRAAAGARATLGLPPGADNPFVLETRASHVRYQGLEVRSDGGASPADDSGAAILVAAGRGVELVDLDVHANPRRTGIDVQRGPLGLTVSGCLVRDNGASEARPGHGLYLNQDARTDPITVRGSLVFANHGAGVHAWSNDQPIAGLVLDRVGAWANGEPSGVAAQNVVIASQTIGVSDVEIIDGIFYHPADAAHPALGVQIGGYAGPNVRIGITGNLIVGGDAAVGLWDVPDLVFDGNAVVSLDRTLVRLIGAGSGGEIDHNQYEQLVATTSPFELASPPAQCDFVCWREGGGRDPSGSWARAPLRVAHWPSEHDADRQIVVVAQPNCVGDPTQCLASVGVSFDAWLTNGDRIRVTSADDPWGAPLVEAEHVEGVSIDLPLAGAWAPEIAGYVVRRVP